MMTASVLLFIAVLTPVAVNLDDSVDGREVLERMISFYADQEQMQAAVEVRIDAPGMPPGMGGSMVHDLAVQRPDKVALRQVSGAPAGSFVVNGTTRYTAMDQMKRYSVDEGPATLAEALTHGSLMVPTIPASMLLANLLGDAGTSGALAGAAEVESQGTEMIEGFLCHHLRLAGGSVDVELWIDAGEEPWLRRLVPLPPADMGAADDGMIMIVPEFWLREWSGGPVADEVFSTEPPSGFTRVDNVMPDLPGMMSGGSPNRGAAPSLTLDLLDGTSVELSSLRGKVVVLAFWATWCKPCLMELPLLIEVTNDLAQRDVVFYAVNVAESEQTVRAGLARYELEVTVALDQQGRMAKAFGVRPIPHTVIIDQDGDIIAEHVGYMPGIEKIVRREIEALLPE